MNRTLKRIIAATGATTLLAVGTACSVRPEPDMVVVHFKGGSTQAKTFEGCIEPGTKETKGWSEGYFAYPTRQVSYDASTDDGAERGRFSVVSKDGVDLLIPVSVTFTLDTACEDKDSALPQFHQRLGAKYNAYWEEGDKSSDVPEGWIDMLNFVIGKPLDAALDRIALDYNWRDLRSDPIVKTNVERAINEVLNGDEEKNVESLITRQADGDFFQDFSALMQKPDPTNPDLLQAIADQQTRVTEAEAEKAKAEADTATARSRQDLARAEAFEQRATILGFKLPGMTSQEAVDAYRKFLMVEKGLNPDQPTYIVGGTQPQPTS